MTSKDLARTRLWCAGIALLGLALAAPAHAASCTVSSIGVAFGVYDPLSTTPTDASGSITVTCVWTSAGGPGTQTVTPVIALSAGLSPGTYAQRVLRTAAGDRLNYNLFRNTARTQIFGDGSSGTVTAPTSPTTLSVPPSGSPRTGTRPIYGRMPAGQSTAVPGSYSDTITVTVTF